MHDATQTHQIGRAKVVETSDAIEIFVPTQFTFRWIAWELYARSILLINSGYIVLLSFQKTDFVWLWIGLGHVLICCIFIVKGIAWLTWGTGYARFSEQTVVLNEAIRKPPRRGLRLRAPDVSGLRVDLSGEMPARAIWQVGVFSSGCIVFYNNTLRAFQPHTHRFGRGLTQDEAQKIVELVTTRFPQFGT